MMLAAFDAADAASLTPDAFTLRCRRATSAQEFFATRARHAYHV